MALVLALSVSGSISQLSVIVAAAALLGVAVLTLLFFAQAREVKRLREWGAQAADRLAELTRQQAALATRTAQRLPQGAQGPPQARAPVPAGQVARATPLISRAPAAVAATNAGGSQLAPAAGGIALVPTAAGTAVPGLPVAGEQAPAQAIAAAATATSPALATAVASPAVPALGDLVAPGSPNDSATGSASQDDGAPAEAAVLSASPAVAAAATTPRPARSPLPPAPDEDPTHPARSVPEQRAAAPVRAASATGLAEESRLAQKPRLATSAARTHTGDRSPLPPGPPAARRAADGGGQRRRPTIYRRERSGVRPLAIAVGALVVIVLAAVLIVSALGSSGRKAANAGSAGATAGGHRLARDARGHATPIGSLRVVVLNATQVNGLAAHVANNLKSHGYNQASPLFGTPSGAYPTTTVQYAEGHAGDAAGVANVLKASSAGVKPMQSAVAPLSGGAPVVVVVGEATANEGAGGATKGAEAAPAEGEQGAETAGAETAEGGEAPAGSQAAEPGA